MLKSWTKFLESFESDFYHDEFISLLNNLTGNFDLPSQFHRNYSYTAQSNKGDIDPEEDFKIIDSYMEENGWPFSVVKQYAKIWYDDGILYNGISGHCAPVDYYLYKATDGKFPLQGFEWNNVFDTEEYLIKFQYGWHLTRYGRLCIQQNMTLKEFFSKVTTDLGFSEIIYGFIRRYISDNHIIPLIDDAFFVQDDECYLDLELYAKFLISEIGGITKSQAIDELTEYLTLLGFKLRIIGDDLIIKYNLKDDNKRR